MLSSLDLIQKDCSSLKCIYLINFEISKYSSVQFSIDKLIYKTFEFLTACMRHAAVLDTYQFSLYIYLRMDISQRGKDISKEIWHYYSFLARANKYSAVVCLRILTVIFLT